MRQKFKDFNTAYPHAWTVLYFAVYLAWFIWLERTPIPYHVIHFPLDDYIPFCEFFIIPYFLWFLYVGAVYFYLMFRDKENYFRYIGFLYIGMTLFLVVSTVYPNGHLLRPLNFNRNNPFIQMVCFLYWADTPTNILPSIHVFNSIATHMAIMNTPSLRAKKWTVNGSRILCVSIILSTMFLKQHSCIDVMLGIVCGIVMNWLIYHTGFLVKTHHLIRKLVSDDRDLSSALSGEIHRSAEDAEV